MTDIVDRDTRSRMMSRIRGRDTKPELVLRAALRRVGLTGYRVHWRGAPGRPDIAFPGLRIAIFVDGAFWHGHPDYFTFGKSGPKWDAKIRRNMERDREVDTQLSAAEWRFVRVWDFEVLKGADLVAARLEPVIAAARAQKRARGSSERRVSASASPPSAA